MQAHFQKYYDTVMPYLKTILVSANDKQNRMLRAKSMECISLVGMAVGKDKFRVDAKQVMNLKFSQHRVSPLILLTKPQVQILSCITWCIILVTLKLCRAGFHIRARAKYFYHVPMSSASYVNTSRQNKTGLWTLLYMFSLTRLWRSLWHYREFRWRMMIPPLVICSRFVLQTS